MDVQVLPHDSNWASSYENASRQVLIALGGNAISIHHIGSTAILGIYAKPIIDILVAVIEICEVDKRESEMSRLGYEAKGEFGIPLRRYFRRNNELGQRTHHVHVFQKDSDQFTRHLFFRDFLMAHPSWACKYSDLKRNLAELHPNSMAGYVAGKDAFIKQIDALAAVWNQSIGG
jgi:GrpB-like predicted nucleotidyltransferase (UPF0157 family)